MARISGSRIFRPSRTDVAVFLLILLAAMIGLLVWHVVHDQWGEAFLDFLAIVAIRTYPWTKPRAG